MNNKTNTEKSERWPRWLWRLVRLLGSDKWLTVIQVISATIYYAGFGYDGQWSAAAWCAVSAMMSLLYYDEVRRKGATINQTDIEADEELAEAVETINDYVRRRDASA